MDFFVWQRTIVDEAGNVLPSASVSVTDVVSGALVQLYSDEGSTGIGNPITADANGFVQFFVKSGIYTIVATSGANTRTWTKEAIGSPDKRNADEVSASATPVDYRKLGTPIRDLSRYVSDNTGVSNVSSQVQAAIDAAAVRGGEVIVPEGSYLCSGVNLSSDVRIEGTSKRGCVFMRNGSSAIFTNAAATLYNVLRNLTFDANGDRTNALILLLGGTSHLLAEDLRAINFDNSTTACPLLQVDALSSAANEDIHVVRPECIYSSAATQNYQSILIYNPRLVRVLDGNFKNSGAIVTATSSTFSGGMLGDVIVARNRLEGVDSSAIMLRANGAVTIEGLHALFNVGRDVSPSLGKFFVTIQHQPGASGSTIRNVEVIGNDLRGTDVSCAGGLLVQADDADLLEGVVIEKNVINLLQSDGSVFTTGNNTQRGIEVFGPTATPGRAVAIRGNVVVGSQSGGIVITDLRGSLIDGNSLDRCLQDSTAGASEGAIWLAQGTMQDNIVRNNTIIDCGGGGASHAGIAIGSGSTLSDNEIDGNNISDRRGGSGMKYGISVGAAAVNTRLGYENKIRGAATASINSASNGLTTVFSSTDATPSVSSRARWFQTNNGSATTITDFDDTENGQEFFVLVADGNTTIDFTGTNLRGNAGADKTCSNGDHMRVKVVGSTKYIDFVDS